MQDEMKSASPGEDNSGRLPSARTMVIAGSSLLIFAMFGRFMFPPSPGEVAAESPPEIQPAGGTSEGWLDKALGALEKPEDEPAEDEPEPPSHPRRDATVMLIPDDDDEILCALNGGGKACFDEYIPCVEWGFIDGEKSCLKRQTLLTPDPLPTRRDRTIPTSNIAGYCPSGRFVGGVCWDFR